MLKVDEASNIADDGAIRPLIKGKNKLLQVALINSYLVGQSHLLEVDNNTVITGRNNSGKTTLMGAITPFYGTKLSDIAKKNEAYDSFVDFYLPYADSYIVYEYIRLGKKNCVILRRTNEGQQVFNFVNTAYDESWFVKNVDNKIKFRQFEEVKKVVENQGNHISPNVKQMAYEAIISNCPRYRLKNIVRSDAAFKSIRTLQPDYSLATGKGSFYGFSSIASNILKSRIEFDQICEFLVEAMKSENKVQGNEMSMDSQGVDTSKWIKDRNSWREVEDLRDKFNALNRYVEQNASNQNNLSKGVNALDNLKLSFEYRLSESKKLEDQYTKDVKEISNQISNIEIGWNNEKADINSEMRQIEKTINKLEKIKRDFEQGVQNEHHALTTLEQMISQIERLTAQKEHHLSLLKEFEKKENDAARIIDRITETYKTTLREIKSSRTQLETITSLDLQKIESTFNSSQIEILKRQASDIKVVERNYKTKHENIKEQINGLNIERAKFEEYLKHVYATPELVKQIENTALSIDGYRTQLSTDITNKNESENMLRDTADTYKSLQSDYADNQRKIDSETSALNELQNLRQEGNLLSFLLKSEEHQFLAPTVAQIRKIIDPSLFNRSDLSPSWSGYEIDTITDKDAPTDDSVFGLILDTDKIDTSNSPEKSITHNSIAKKRLGIEETISKLNENANLLEKQIKKAKISQDNAREKVHKAEVTVKNTQQFIKSQEATLKQLKLREIQEVSDAKERASNNIKQTDEKIESKSLYLNATYNEEALEVKKIENKYEEKIAYLKHEKELKENKVNSQKDKRLNSLKEEEALAKKRYENAKSENGYDDSVIVQTREKIDNISKEIELSEMAKFRVQLYYSFMEEEYAAVPNLITKKDDLSTTLIHKETANSEIVRTKKQRKDALIEETETITNKIKKAGFELDKVEEHLKHAKNLLNQSIVTNKLPAYDCTAYSLSDLHNASLGLLNETKELIKDTKINTKQGLDALRIIRKPFTSNESMFESLMSDDLVSRAPDESTWFIQAAKFTAYLDNEQQIKKDTLISQYRVAAYQVNEFKSKLDKAHNSLSNFSNRLNASCKTVCNMLQALAIEELVITINSGIKENRWYSTLQDFSEAHIEWAESDLHNRDRMPNEELLAKLQRVQDYIGQNQMNIKLSEQFNFSLMVKQVGKEAKHTKRVKVFKDMGSNGTMRIAQLIIYISLLKVISNSEDVVLKFFIDEIGVLDHENTQELLSLLENFGISAMCAAPENPDDEVIPMFTNNIACHHNRIQKRYELSQTDDMRMLTQDWELDKFGVFG
ncbi:ATP-binding protein [Psychrobacter sp. NPDC064578]|uniref:ATP-binding protein n=1 Tax=Psychrobacter sp. NPDC064578 TaxID=3364493 RepID=UPI00384B845A